MARRKKRRKKRKVKRKTGRKKKRSKKRKSKFAGKTIKQLKAMRKGKSSKTKAYKSISSAIARKRR